MLFVPYCRRELNKCYRYTQFSCYNFFYFLSASREYCLFSNALSSLMICQRKACGPILQFESLATLPTKTAELMLSIRNVRIEAVDGIAFVFLQDFLGSMQIPL